MKTIGNYKLLANDKLGEGTLGKTCKAYHAIKNTQIVMRILQKNQYCEQKHTKESLKAEIKFYSKIKHENLANYIDVIETKNNFYILREFCPDGSLRDLMKTKQKFTQKEVMDLLVQIVKGMIELVQKGIAHKNLTPENILFNKNLLKISDFGMDKIGKQILQDPTMKGHSEYKSPELLDGARGNFKCDIWALGVIIYELIYGKRPWIANNEAQLRQKISQEKIKFPQDVPISIGMKKFILSCLMQDAQQRAEWKEILQSNILHDYQLPKLQNLNETYTHILSLLKSSIIQSNLDVERYFKSRQLVSQDILEQFFYQFNKKAFSILVKPMIKGITEEEIDFLYLTLDRNGDNKLQLSEFEDAMQQFDIPLKGSYRRIAQKLLKDDEIDKELQEEQKKEQELQFIYKGLIENLQKKQIYDLYDVFIESDKKRVGVLEFDEFVTLLRKIDKTLTKTECQKVFVAFDRNGDKKISFNQFFANMCKITGSPNGLPKN